MQRTDCLQSQHLTEYLHGKLAAAEAEMVADHVETCLDCEGRLRDLERETVAARGTPPEPLSGDTFAEEPECGQFIESLREVVSLEATDANVSLTPPTPAPTVEERPPTGPILGTIRDYQLLEKLSQGGAGTVYKAHHMRLNRVVAVKVLSDHVAADKKAVSRFQREIKLIGKLQDPHIVQALDAGESEGRRFLAMELVDGYSIAQISQALGPLKVADACEVARQAALALVCVHEHGIVHRDIKPSNLMLNRAGQVKLLDLGLGRLAGSDSALTASLTMTGQVMGTFDYMAPEQADNSQTVDIRADLYSLGATLYQLLAGHPPFAGAEHDNFVAKLEAHRKRQVPSLQDARPDCPPAVCRVVHQLLEKSPRERFQTPSEVVEALQPACAGSDLLTVIRRTAEATVVDRSSLTRLSGLASSIVGTGRSRWLTLLAIMLSLVALAVVMQVATNRGELMITSEVPGVEVAVRQRDKTVESLEVLQTPLRTKLYAGDYEVVVTGADAEQMRVSPDKVQLTRGDSVAVTIERIAAEPASVAWVGSTVVFVRSAAAPDGNGESWNRAFRDLQQALDATRGTDTLLQVWVAAGKYVPTSDSDDRSASFVLANNVTLLGGFAGNEASADERRPRENLTVLSGDLRGDDQPEFAGTGENSYHVVVSKGNDETAVLDGFVITGGNATEAVRFTNRWEEQEPTHADGGGLIIDSGSPTIRNCTIVSNQARLRGGGAINWRGTPKLSDCYFFRNRCAYAGGGLINAGMFEHEMSGNAWLRDCAFLGNQGQRGGGLLHWWGVPSNFQRCTFAYNLATSDNAYAGGGGIYHDATSSSYVDCLIFRNKSFGRGGGVNAKWRPQASFVNCTIAHNEAAAGQGGGIFVHNGGYPELFRSVVWDNGGEPLARGGGSGGADVVASECNIQGGWTGESNIDTDPHFVDAAEDEFALADDSPCMGKGARGSLNSSKVNSVADSLVKSPFVQLDLAKLYDISLIGDK